MRRVTYKSGGNVLMFPGNLSVRVAVRREIFVKV